MLTKEDANNVVNAWESLAGKELKTMLTFYNSLFEMAPEIRFYFPDDMNALSQKLKMTIDIVISNIHDMDALIPELHRLGRYHKHQLALNHPTILM